MKYTDPDSTLINYLEKDNDLALSTCMQCGSCTAVCELSPPEKPFPRKEMIWAAWGLKDKILGDPDIWLCFQCGDCSETCPRDVRPGDVISSLRNFSYLHYARPRFMGKWMQQPKYLPLLILFPAVVIAGIIALAGTLKVPDGPVNYSVFFPHAWLNISFSVILLVLIGFILNGFRKFHGDLLDNLPQPSNPPGLLKCLGQVFTEVMIHKNFRECTTNRFRFTAHFLVFWGFVLLLAVTLFAILSTILFEYPLSFLNPVKITGNLAGVMLLTGTGIMIIQRLKKNKPARTNYSDWFFLISLFLLTLSGIFVEIARFGSWASAYYLYFIHLVLVWMIVMYLPYTKFGHIVYRTTALVYAKRSGR